MVSGKSAGLQRRTGRARQDIVPNSSNGEPFGQTFVLSLAATQKTIIAANAPTTLSQRPQIRLLGDADDL
jgi:hypothetical protein